jgi:hypothetical protein
MKNKNNEAVAKPFYTSTPSNERVNHKHQEHEHSLIQLQQLAKQIERKYPKGYQGL